VFNCKKIKSTHLNFLFAWRYFRSKKSTNAINIIAWVTVAAMAVGTAALVIVLSIFNGFEGLVKDLYSSFYPDVRIKAVNEKVVVLDSTTVAKIKLLSNVEAVSLVVEENVHLKNGDFRTNGTLKGVDENYTKVTGVQSSVITGKFTTGTDEAPSLVLGSGVENALGLMSDRAVNPVTAYLPKRGIGVTDNPMEAISTVNFLPAGSFSIQQDFDNKYVITNLTIVKQMIGLNSNEYSAAEIKIRDLSKQKQTILDLQKIVGSTVLVENRYEQNRSLFGIMQMEKWIIFGILSLILVIAAFNIIGALTMLVLEKEQDIQILKAMGAGNSFIQRIFLSEGLLLSVAGSIIGVGLGILFCFLQVTFKIIPLEGSFVIDYYPVKILVTDLLLVMLVVFVIALIASWLPSVKAARQQVSLRAQ
jgi:lipoprotein-releasing system permease protein